MTNAEDLLQNIFKTKNVFDSQEEMYELESNIDEEEGGFLSGLIEKYKAKNTIEIGCAQGISSLFICNALQKLNENGRHTIVEPFQKMYRDAGKANLRRAGLTNYEFIEKVSELALPELLAADKKFDFAFIDGWHTFDHTLLDFFYLNRMIAPGGIIVIDDVGMAGINKAVRYISNYPAYEFEGGVKMRLSGKRKLFDKAAKTPFRLFSKILPRKLRHEFFSGSVITSDAAVHTDCSMVAFKKIKPDDRNWNWFKDF